MDIKESVLSEPFNIKIHKQHFEHYLEVIILSDGTIEYAVPSHSEKLIRVACIKLNMDRDELNDACPSEYYADFIGWLCKITGCISVWNQFYQGEPNIDQIKNLKKLKLAGIYNGEI